MKEIKTAIGQNNPLPLGFEMIDDLYQLFLIFNKFSVSARQFLATFERDLAITP